MRNEKYRFLQLMIEGKIEGRRGIERKKMSGFGTSDNGQGYLIYNH